jgi:Family of unknown function (DUF6232)
MDSNESNQSEKIFYQDQNVIVTNSRVVASGKTYAMSNISSVTNFRIVKNSTIGIVIIVVGGLSLFSGEWQGWLFGIIVIILGAVIIRKKKDYFSVQISSNSGESKAIISKDKNYVQKIVDAVNEAIIYRG